MYQGPPGGNKAQTPQPSTETAPGAKKDATVEKLPEDVRERIITLLSGKLMVTTGRAGFSEEEEQELKEKIGEDKLVSSTSKCTTSSKMK